MKNEITPGQLEAAATVLLFDGSWRPRRWIVRSLPGTDFETKWALVKRLIADGTLEQGHDNWGTDLVRLAPK